MNCDFCSRGDAQDIDISTKIIDTTLNRVKDYEIYMIRITGGEPFLNKRGLLYLVNEIIQRNIMIAEFCVFTNGTIIDNEIKEALVKIGEHCKRCQDSGYGKEIQTIHYYNTHSFASVIVSTTEHKPIDIDRALNFYKDDVDESILCSYNQDESFIYNNTNEKIVGIALEGNGLVNYKKFIQKGKCQFSFINNKFCLIDDSKIGDGYINIIKTITISSNGNVFAGCSQSYDKLDKENICNILRCCDLFVDIDLYSWKYPLLERQNATLKGWLKYRWDYEHRTSTKQDYDVKIYKIFGTLIEGMYDLENYIRSIHRKYPYFTHIQAATLATYSNALQFFDEEKEDWKKPFYLQAYSGVEHPEVYEKITREEIANVCINLYELYKQYILNNNQYYKFLYENGLV